MMPLSQGHYPYDDLMTKLLPFGINFNIVSRISFCLHNLKQQCAKIGEYASHRLHVYMVYPNYQFLLQFN